MPAEGGNKEYGRCRMSLVIERFLMCDGYECDEQYGIDAQYKNGIEHRNDAKKEGWHYCKDEDFCPVCWKELKRR